MLVSLRRKKRNERKKRKGGEKVGRGRRRMKDGRRASRCSGEDLVLHAAVSPYQKDPHPMHCALPMPPAHGGFRSVRGACRIAALENPWPSSVSFRFQLRKRRPQCSTDSPKFLQWFFYRNGLASYILYNVTSYQKVIARNLFKPIPSGYSEVFAITLMWISTLLTTVLCSYIASHRYSSSACPRRHTKRILGLVPTRHPALAGVAQAGPVFAAASQSPGCSSW